MRKLIAHQCCDHLTAVETRYPLTSITWPYRGLRCRPIQVQYCFKLPAVKLLVLKWPQAQFFKLIWNMLRLCHYGPAPLTFWFQTDLGRENSACYLKIQAGKTDAFHFSHHSYALVTLQVQFYALIGQNLTGEFMRKIYAASWNLFSLTAETDRVLCQLVMFLTVFLHWMYKMKYSCYQETSVIHGGWFVYWIFGWEIRRLSKSEIRFWMASFLFFTLLDRCVRLGSDAVLVMCQT